VTKRPWVREQTVDRRPLADNPVHVLLRVVLGSRRAFDDRTRGFHNDDDQVAKLGTGSVGHWPVSLLWFATLREGSAAHALPQHRQPEGLDITPLVAVRELVQPILRLLGASACQMASADRPGRILPTGVRRNT
jgi:hypothetical protein